MDSVSQERWVDLLYGRLGCSITCTVHSGNPELFMEKLQIALDV